VIFISPQNNSGNQGILITQSDEGVQALRELGQNLGVISLGRKIVLIEGVEKSLDRDTYGATVQGRYPGLVLAPSGSRQTTLSLAKMVEEVLNKTLWGLDFFMLSDRDNSLPTQELQRLESESQGRLRFLKRYHLENYFLEPALLSEVFRNLTESDHWLRDAEKIRQELVTLASELIPVAVNLWLGTQVRSYIGEVDVFLKHTNGKDLAWFQSQLKPRLQTELGRVSSYLDLAFVEDEVERRWKELQNSLTTAEGWKVEFPGKILLSQFCSRANMNRGYFLTSYLSVARADGYRAFQDILDIFDHFEKISAS
jgi:hypothetical protein